MRLIDKNCCAVDLYRRPYQVYKRARDAFGYLLDFLGIGEGSKLLMPGYIGWSAREGSGVFDPVAERSIVPVFYHLNRRLEIDEQDLREKILLSGAKALLVIHYFGFVDTSLEQVCAFAKENGLCVIEDAAHALYTDRIGGLCGEFGDYTLYSLHKMLPMPDGGMLVENTGMSLPPAEEEYQPSQKWDAYDLWKIAVARVKNYSTIKEELESRECSEISILRPVLRSGVVPQTFPILIKNENRDLVYAQMNDLGWGVVSLYHTMIDCIAPDQFPDESWVSKHITNLPVHQDVDVTLIKNMVDDLIRIVCGK